MSDSVQADVIVPVYRDTAMTVCCLESVLAHSGAALRSLIVVNDASPDPDMEPALTKLASSDSRILRASQQREYGIRCDVQSRSWQAWRRCGPP